MLWGCGGCGDEIDPHKAGVLRSDSATSQSPPGSPFSKKVWQNVSKNVKNSYKMHIPCIFDVIVLGAIKSSLLAGKP